MRQYVYSLRSASLLLIAVSLGCSTSATEPMEISSRNSEVLLDLPEEPVFALAASPDGTLFASTSRAIYEASAPYRAFSRIAETHGPLISLAAPSADTIYGIGRGPFLFIWSRTEGLSAIPSPLNDSVRVVEHSVPQGFTLFAVWAPSPREAYAAGLDGVILHAVDGVAQIEPNPMVGMVNPDTYPRAPIYDITGRGDRVYAIARIHLMERTKDGWVLMKRPPGFDGPREAIPCGFFSAAVFEERLVVGGGERACLYTLTGDRWSGPVRFPEGGGNYQGGQLQSSGAALFYSGTSIISVAASGEATRYQATEFQIVREAVSIGADLYIAGLMNDRGVIVRVPGHS